MRLRAASLGLLMHQSGLAFAQSESPLATKAIPHSGEKLPVIGLGTANDFMAPPEGDAAVPKFLEWLRHAKPGFAASRE